MSLPSLAILAALLLLQLSGCVTAGQQSGASVNELERRHDEMMERAGGGSGGGGGSM